MKLIRSLIWVLVGVSASRHAMGATPGCSFGTYNPTYGGYSPTHQALVLTDPAGEQTAKFDLAFGGTLVSLNYQNTELIYGDVTGAQVQTAWFTGRNDEMGFMGQFYNPETGGDNALYPPGGPQDLSHPEVRGNLTHGAYCTGANSATILTTMTDYLLGRSGIHQGYGVYSFGPQRGSPNPYAQGCAEVRDNCPLYTTPYSITTLASFVPNASGALPHYYLKQTQIATNVSATESYFWSFTLSLYGWNGSTTQPQRFINTVGYPSGPSPAPTCIQSTTCDVNSTPTIAVGAYPSSGLTAGIAISYSPLAYGNFYPGVNKVYYTLNDINADIWLTAWPLAPNQENRWTWYVMAGNWSTALTFAQAH